MKKLCCIVGARPNFMKIAPIMRELEKNTDSIKTILVHTGQHYDESMNDTFFEQLEIPRPDVHMGIGSASHAVQTADIMKNFETVLRSEKPDAILVVGDVNSTIACALVAAKENVRVIHVEAGLRSYDRAMPEEINRILTDQLSDLLFITEKDARQNLEKEGISGEKIQFVGNVMIDTLFHNLNKTEDALSVFEKRNIGINSDSNYGVLTLHRPSNVDDPNCLRTLLETIGNISKKIPLVFPVHPRTAQKIKDANLQSLISKNGIYAVEPLSYLELLGLMKNATLVLTDSGGIQEETTALGVPCITLRENTERPITITNGTNTLAGTDRNKILEAADDILKSGGKSGRIPELWDGHAAERIVTYLKEWL